MNKISWILLSLAIVSAVAFIVFRTWKGGLYAMLLKTLASLCFVVMGVVGLATSTLDNKAPLALIVIGLLFGMVGDILLDLKVLYDNDKVYLNFGMLSFGLGHMAYFSAFTLFAYETETSLWLPVLVSIGVALAVTAVILIGGKKLMRLDFGDYLWQTVAYTIILAFMVEYSLILAIMDAGMWMVFVAFALFFLSDAVLSNQYFGGKLHSRPYIAINHTLYYSAQILLALVVFLV